MTTATDSNTNDSTKAAEAAPDNAVERALAAAVRVLLDRERAEYLEKA